MRRTATSQPWRRRRPDVDPDDVLAFDVMFHDLTPSRLVGIREDMVSAPRIDNLLSCHAGTDALVAAAEGHGPVPVLALFDHEEVGSVSSTGAAGPLLERTLRRFVGLDARPIGDSIVFSVDGAHATHPNYPGAARSRAPDPPRRWARPEVQRPGAVRHRCNRCRDRSGWRPSGLRSTSSSS